MTDRRECHDPRFGPVAMEVADRRWTVDLADATLALDAESGVVSDPAGGGRAWSGREAFLRRTYDGHAELVGRRYRLRQRRGKRATLVRDGRSIATLRAGSLRAATEHPCGFAVQWLPGTPDAVDARVAYLLAGVWGVGARGAVSRLAEGLFPGLLGP